MRVGLHHAGDRFLSGRVKNARGRALQVRRDRNDPTALHGDVADPKLLRRIDVRAPDQQVVLHCG